MGVIGMKVYGAGRLVSGAGGISASEAMSYVLSLTGVSTVIIGCQTPAEVEENVRIAREFAMFEAAKMRDLESRTRPLAPTVASYKRA